MDFKDGLLYVKKILDLLEKIEQSDSLFEKLDILKEVMQYVDLSKPFFENPPDYSQIKESDVPVELRNLSLDDIEVRLSKQKEIILKEVELLKKQMNSIDKKDLPTNKESENKADN